MPPAFVRFERNEESTFKRVYFEEGDRSQVTGHREEVTGHRSEEIGKAGGRIRLQALNPAFASRVVEREEVAGMYAAVYVVRAVGGVRRKWTVDSGNWEGEGRGLLADGDGADGGGEGSGAVGPFGVPLVGSETSAQQSPKRERRVPPCFLTRGRTCLLKAANMPPGEEQTGHPPYTSLTMFGDRESVPPNAVNSKGRKHQEYAGFSDVFAATRRARVARPRRLRRGSGNRLFFQTLVPWKGTRIARKQVLQFTALGATRPPADTIVA